VSMSEGFSGVHLDLMDGRADLARLCGTRRRRCRMW